jgi:outer membrane protein
MTKGCNTAIYTLLVLASLMPAPLTGQISEPKTLTLEQAVQIAVERNQELAAARLEIQKSDAQVREAYGYAMPSLDLSSRYTRALKKPVFFLPDFENPNSGRIVPIEIGSNHAVDMSLSARQVLFNAGVITGVGAAKVYSRAARELYQSKELETITKVRRSFYGLLLAREVDEMMKANLANAEENLSNVQLLLRQGLVSEYDELRATVGVENLRPAVIEAENNAVLALDGLRAVMGVGPAEEFVIEGRLTFTPVDQELLASALETMLENNPLLKAMRLQIEVNQAVVNVERSNYLPTLAAFGMYQYQVAKNSMNISTRDFIGSSQVGLTLSINLFQGLQTNARVDQAKVDVRKSEEMLSSVETGLQTAVHSILMQLQQARKRVEAQGKTVEQAERGYKIATTRFVSGSGTQLEVNDAQLALTQAKVNRMQAVFDYLVASAELEQVSGRRPAYLPNIDED